MPLYFAYGQTMDATAMRLHAPKAEAVGLCRLARHRFVVMASGYASVRRDPAADVHGMLYDVPLSDMRGLDRSAAVGGGLYVKTAQPVIRHGGAAVRALLHVGNEAATGAKAPAGYLPAIVAAARAAGLPQDYIATLENRGMPVRRPLALRPLA